jgi:hypothetical protein
MRRALAAAVSAALLLVSVTSLGSAAIEREMATLDFPSVCGTGTPIVDVTQTLLNGIDVNTAGTYLWAYDRTINEHVRYYQLGPNSFCKTRQIDGTFETINGDSPGGTGAIHAGITGTIHSVEAWSFTSTFDPGTHQTHGQLATIDLGCHVQGQPFYFYCTVARGNDADGAAYYFPSGFAHYSLESGYFLYDAGSHGRWLQIGSRSIGDIIG